MTQHTWRETAPALPGAVAASTVPVGAHVEFIGIPPQQHGTLSPEGHWHVEPAPRVLLTGVLHGAELGYDVALDGDAGLVHIARATPVRRVA